MDETTSSVAMVITTMVSDFCDKNEPTTALGSMKILFKLIANAVTPPDERKADRYRRVRLDNSTIRDKVARVPGALDLLALVGFRQIQEGGEEVLLYTPGDQTTPLAVALCHELETCTAELEQKLKPTTKRATTSTTIKTENSPFLSEEDRKIRQAKAAEARTAREKERLETRRRLQEDKQERQEAAARKSAAIKAALMQENLAPDGVVIRTLATNNRGSAPLAAPPPSLVETTKQPAKATKEMQKDATMANTEDSEPNKEIQKDATMANTEESEPVMMETEPSLKGMASMPPATTTSDDDDRKPAAKPSMLLGTTRDDSSFSWEAFMEQLPRCASAPGVRDSSVFHRQSPSSNNGERRRPMCLKRLLKELENMDQSLPTDARCPIWVRFDEESPQYVRALIAAPLPGPSPYSGGLFCFDIFIPDDYPAVPPKFRLLTTGGGTVRFGPNLYADGKVCLSLLGTWPGPKWNPRHSTLYQVLISIQGLILSVEHPYYLEPGHGGWEGRVKEGDFQSVGKNLKGEEIKEELHLPAEVRDYDDQVRVGTVKFAFLEMLRAESMPFLRSFATAIQAHLYHNRTAIVKEVHSWLSGGGSAATSAPQMELTKLFPTLNDRLSALEPPNISTVARPVAAKAPPSMEARLGEDVSMQKPPPNMQGTTEDKQDPSSHVEALCCKMQEAASKGDYILAGKLQEEVQALEDLQRRMKEAAAEGNFIRAGRLQEQFQALVSDPPTPSQVQESFDDEPMHDSWDEDEDEQFDEDFDDGFDETDMPGIPPMGMPGGGNSNVLPPAGYSNRFGNKTHSWGTGNQLGDSSTKATASPTAAFTTAASTVASVAPARIAIPLESACVLRIRLPGSSKSIVEEFDMNESLSAVYKRLEPQVQGISVARPYAAAPPSGAFAQPLSSAGFTLLLSHPKREYSLEMHGTRSLDELGLAPSAHLTCMLCKDRGVAYRGELEDRIRNAQGDSMDVDGLTYEGLSELTEHVGVATPAVDAGTLQRNSSLISPAAYLSGHGSTSADDCHCPICLGEFDPTDTEPNLRKLESCAHCFHNACLETWLSTKSSCPICKQSLSSCT